MQVIETKPKTNNMSKDTWIRAYKQFNEIANPQKTELKDFLEAPFQVAFSEKEIQEQKAYNQYRSVLQLKLDGLEKEPTSIEKTMTRAQLFLCTSPLWTIGLRPNTIKTIISKYRRLKNMGKADVIVPIVNEAITNYGTINHRVFGNIYREHHIG
jgi:hypothetical protein